MKYYLFISSKADVGWSVGSNLIWYYRHQVESPRQLLLNTESRQAPGAGSLSELIPANASTMCQLCSQGSGWASRRPSTLGTLKHRVHNQRAHTLSRKPPQRKSKHAASAVLQVMSIIHRLPTALARAYRRVHWREEQEKDDYFTSSSSLCKTFGNHQAAGMLATSIVPFSLLIYVKHSSCFSSLLEDAISNG